MFAPIRLPGPGVRALRRGVAARAGVVRTASDSPGAKPRAQMPSCIADVCPDTNRGDTRLRTRKELSAREVEDLHQSLMRRLGDSSVPTLPEVAVKVVQLVSNRNATIKDFVEVVQSDQALTARLLRTANSALFAQRQPVTQLQRAMILLGLDRLKAMALGFHLSQAAAKDTGDFSMRKVWANSVFRAWTAFRLTEHFDRKITGEAFIVGLMLDAGLPMMGKLAGEKHAKVVDANSTPLAQFLGEYNNLDFTHVDVIASLCKMWKLPELLNKPIAVHHTRPERMDTKNPESILHAIAYFVGSMTLSSDPAAPARPDMGGMAKNLLGLDAAIVQKTLKDAAADFQGAREMFAHLLDDSTSIESILAAANKELSDTDVQLIEAAKASEKNAAGPALRFDTGALVLEAEKSAGTKVKVYIADNTGLRLSSEEIETATCTKESLRKALMLEDATETFVDNVYNELRRIAA